MAEYVLSREQKDAIVREWMAKWESRSPEQVEYDRDKVERERLLVLRGRKP